jgi:hypothetical protein
MRTVLIIDDNPAVGEALSLALWLLGQVSVLGPARRAAAVPPAVATRSV